ncbi:hypothetical protein, partial [Salmonella phage vB_SalS_TU03]
MHPRRTVFSGAL